MILTSDILANCNHKRSHGRACRQLAALDRAISALEKDLQGARNKGQTARIDRLTMQVSEKYLQRQIAWKKVRSLGTIAL